MHIFTKGLYLYLFESKKTLFTAGTISPKEFSQTLSFHYLAGLIFIPVIIENETYNFMLDTGAFSVLSSALVAKLQLKKHEETIQTLDAFGTSKEVCTYTLPQLFIADTLFEEFTILADDFMHNFPLSNLSFDGVIGYNMLQSLVLTLSYQEQHITLSNAITKPTSNFIITKLKKNDFNAPTFLLNIAKKKVYFGLDTGKNDSLMIGDTDLAEYFKAQEYKHSRTVGTFSSSINGTNPQSFIESYEVENFTIDKKLEIASSIITYAKNAQNIAGNGFLEEFELIIDFTKNRLYLQKLKPQICKKLSQGFGFLSFWNEQDKLYISAIIQDSPAYNSKLKIGDRILSLGELETMNFTQEEYCKFSLFARKPFYEEQKTLALIIKRGAKLIRVTLQKPSL